MIELSHERIDQILHEETLKREDLDTILRSIYSRYMNLYEKYFADIDALDDEKIAAMREYNEETRSLIKYYYMDIPLDICTSIDEFESEYSDNLLGPGWHEYLTDAYEEFKKESKEKHESEEAYKKAFKEQALSTFYDAMDYIFRVGFDTGSKAAESTLNRITGLLFGKEE